MKFVIQGKQYDVEGGLSNATLQTLYVLKVRQGIGMKSLLEAADKMSKIADPLDLLEDAEMFKVLMAIIWLARKGAGENITFEEANEVGIGQLEVLNDDEPEEEADAVDPKAVSGPDAVPPQQATPTT
jgi:hypothetical protein